MMDRGKIVSAYECVITRGKPECECGKCDYHIKDSSVFFCDNQRVLTDVLALLKEQETVDHAMEILRNNGWIEHTGSYPKDRFSPVVRCKDCIHWDKGCTEECDNSDNVCYHNGRCKPDWFCADGVKQE